MKIILILICALVFVAHSYSQDSIIINKKVSISDSIKYVQNYLIKGEIIDASEKSICCPQVYFKIDGETFERNIHYYGHFEILVQNFNIVSDSVFFRGKFVGFEQNKIDYELEDDNTINVRLNSEEKTYPVLGGVIFFEERYNIRDTKVITIKSEEIRGMPRR